jgi:2Fe-2S ferredoxin
MPKIVFIEHNGTQHVVDAPAGKSVMQIAVDNLIPGIVGDCGGCCSCATCHAYVDPADADKLPPVQEDEEMMLEGVSHQQPNSRLTCQLRLNPALDTITFLLPESQF